MDRSALHVAKSCLQAARESIVLLKNQNHTLPLKSGVSRITVVGPTAELVQSLQGNYNGPPPSPVYPLEGIEKRFSSAKVTYAQGSTLVEGFAMPIEHTALHPSSGSGEGLTGEYFSSPDHNIILNWIEELKQQVPVKWQSGLNSQVAVALLLATAHPTINPPDSRKTRLSGLISLKITPIS